jgi:hypothetical protein
VDADPRARDALTALLLGGFLVVFALPVLVGAAIAELPVDRVLSMLAGLALLVVGVGFLAWGRRRRRAKDAR